MKRFLALFVLVLTAETQAAPFAWYRDVLDDKSVWQAVNQLAARGYNEIGQVHEVEAVSCPDSCLQFVLEFSASHNASNAQILVTASRMSNEKINVNHVDIRMDTPPRQD